MGDDQTADEIEHRLAAGEWLRPGEIAILFDVARSTVDRWLTGGVRIGGQRRSIRYAETAGGHRTAHPEDVGWLLAETRRVRGGEID